MKCRKNVRIAKIVNEEWRKVEKCKKKGKENKKNTQNTAKDFRFSQQYYTKPTTAIRCHRNYLFYVCVERSTAKK